LRKLGFVGSLVPHKGPHVLLEALRDAAELGVECRIHGPLRPGDRYCARLQHLAADDARVRLLGGFAPEELALQRYDEQKS
jgi:glycosyltransferase involved in cell wall biosynthesis